MTDTNISFSSSSTSIPYPPSASDPLLRTVTWNAKLKNGDPVSQVDLLLYSTGELLTSLVPDSSGDYPLFLLAGTAYVIVYIGTLPYRPECFYYLPT